ncbi:MAG TPA: hypothetical protein VMF87_21030 [Streptosporangiaceae bacterium]|nr:hypothetical protein [Streptosporangiaceae bacterium]
MPARPLSEGPSPGGGATGPAGPRAPAPAWSAQPDPDRVIEPDEDPPDPAPERPEPAGEQTPGPAGAQPGNPLVPAPQPASAGSRPPGGGGHLVPRRGAEVGRPDTGQPALPSGPEITPSWTKVAGTTLQLFLERRRTRWRVTAGLVLAVIIFVGGGLTVALIRNSGPAPAARAGHSPRAPRTPGLAQVQAATAARLGAAAWVAAQVSHSAVVACDPAMCAALQTQGFPAGNLMTISPATSDPLGSTVIVATAAVRSQFGSRLETVFAPTVIASFGSGSAQVDVRVYAAGGGPAYLSALRADLQTRQNLGRVLLRNSRVSATPAARAELAAGQVDTRLLATIATLAGGGRVSVVAFSDSGPGASLSTPLRVAELASPPGANSGYLPGVLASLRAQQAPYLATSLSLARVDGEEVVRIEFAAPSPLGLMSG